MMADETQNRVQRVIFAIYLVLIFSLGFMKPQVDTGSASLTPTDLIFPVLAVCCLVGLATGSFAVKSRFVLLPVLIYFLAVAPSVIFSVNRGFSIPKLVGVAYLILLAVATANIVTSENRLRLVVITWLIGAMVPVAVAIVGVLVAYIAPGSGFLNEITYHAGAVPLVDIPRVSSTFLSPSMFCNYMTVSFVMALIAICTGWLDPKIGWTMIALITTAAAFTFSIAIGGIFFAIGLWMWYGGARTISKAAAVLSLAVAGFFIVIAPIDLKSFGGSASIAPSSRVFVWSDAINTFLSSPLTGKGLGTGAAGVRSLNADGSWSVLIDAHNTFLNVAAESGLFGVAGLIALIVMVIYSAFGRGDSDNDLRRVRVALGIAFVSAWVYDGMTGSFEDARHLWVLIGLIFAAETISVSQGRAGVQLEPSL